MKVTKKIGKKYVNDKKRNKVNENHGDKDSLDTDISSSGGADTLDTSVQKKNDTDKKKKKTVEWIKPKRQPTTKEQRTLFGKAMEVMIITCMDNHVYQFENKVRLQKQGGPIGLKLTGEIADCLMIDWDKKLLNK